MTPVLILTLLLTGITALTVIYSLKSFKSIRNTGSEWPFSVLGVKPTDSLDSVKKAYREMVKRYHPDRLPHDASPQLKRLFEDRLIQVNNAYKTILSLRETSVSELKVDLEELREVGEIIERAEKMAVSGENPKTIIQTVYEAAEKLVKSLHRSAGLVGKSEHFYDLLTDLMVQDILTVEEFEVLAQARRLLNLDDGDEISFKEAVANMRRVRSVYLKLRDRCLKDRNG